MSAVAAHVLEPFWPLLAAAPVVALLAATLRSRTFGAAVAVFFAISIAIWAGLDRGLPAPQRWVVRALSYLALVHFAMLIRPRLRPGWYRALVSLPALGFMAGTWLSIPWAIAGALGAPLTLLTGWWLPFALAAGGLLGSLKNSRGEVELALERQDSGALSRHPIAAPPGGPGDDDIRIFQITDPHLGPFMSPARLRRICERAVRLDPDLVAITGDLLTMESQRDPDALTEALEPLSRLPGRVFACFGNHDHEARATVETALARIGARLLVDEFETAETPAGPVRIIGADFHWQDRQQKLESLMERVGPRGDVPHLLLLHDPGAFRHLPDGSVDLALSGHTHGGQIGLVRFGLRWTIISALSKVPDHGLWSQGGNRLYVHRGTGHYGFPIRLGVPGEESLLRVRFDGRPESPVPS